MGKHWNIFISLVEEASGKKEKESVELGRGWETDWSSLCPTRELLWQTLQPLQEDSKTATTGLM